MKIWVTNDECFKQCELKAENLSQKRVKCLQGVKGSLSGWNKEVKYKNLSRYCHRSTKVHSCGNLLFNFILSVNHCKDLSREMALHVYIMFITYSGFAWKMHCRRHESEWKWKSLSCVQICDQMDSTVHGILQARILEWVAYPFSSRSSWPRDWTRVSCMAGKFFTNWAIREAL